MKKHKMILIVVLLSACMLHGEDYPITPTTMMLPRLGWDCCLQIDKSTLEKRRETTLDVSSLLKRQATFVESIMNAEFIPNLGSQMIPVRGNESEPDRIIYREDNTDYLAEIVIGKYSITTTVVFRPKLHLNDRKDVESLYHEWISIIFKSELLTSYETEVLESNDYPEYWFAGPISIDIKTGARRIPYTWPESIRCAIARDGSCISFSIQKLPHQSSSPPAAICSDSQTGWFSNTKNKTK